MKKPRFSNPVFSEVAQKQLWAKRIAAANKPKEPVLVYRGRGNHSVNELELLVEKYRESAIEKSGEIQRLADEQKMMNEKLRSAEDRNKKLAYEVEQHQRVDYWAERGQAAEKNLKPVKEAMTKIREAILALDPKLFS